MKIAWIGTGVMGAPMASHLANAGHEVTVYNRTFEKAKKLEPLCTAVRTIKEAVREADVVFTIVGYPKDVENVYFGEEGIIKNVQPKTIIVDMTTSSPELAVKIYDEAKKYDVVALDAPVTGGDLGAINATLSIMVGGDPAPYEKVFPLLEKMGKAITYMGAPGNGQNMKLANQVCIAGAIASTAEALTFAKSKNIQPEEFFSVINNGSAASWQAANNGPKMVSQDFDPGFFIKHFVKDLQLAVDNAEGHHYGLTEMILSQYRHLIDQGDGDLGTQAIIKFYEK
ncbi:MAG TPA: NAD(P)-dependent oxidoreductase [Erysipelothrix sp.]|nr:NAD(P)-dependent oxidoreductase [Erysipelothrix sp.]